MELTLPDANAGGLATASSLLVHHPAEGGEVGDERIDDGSETLGELA
jgi:hypothetical protein